jgi:hypothetical protein
MHLIGRGARDTVEDGAWRWARRSQATPGVPDKCPRCELNLLGDPTLDLRAQDPVTPRLDLPDSLATGKQTLNVSTRPGATVCAWKGDEVDAVARTDKQGRASLAICPSTAGKLLVTACGPCINTVCCEITVGKP